MRALVVLCALAVMACAGVQYTAQDCERDVELAQLIAQAIMSTEISDEEKARKAELYSEIVAKIAARGCGFIPPPHPGDIDAALFLRNLGSWPEDF